MAAPAPIDPAALTAALVRRPSVTPEDAGCLDLLAETLAPFGFAAHACDRGAIKNRVFEWRGAPGGPVLGFNGHTDVVPVGDRSAWSVDPFSGLSRDGAIWGRGAVDMKSGVAAFAAAAAAAALDPPAGLGGLALMITGDEEGDGVDGTRAILDWMRAEGRRVDHCVVGEPTSAETFGDVMKIGRRGSVTFDFAAVGRQGHTAYPDRAANPLPALARLLDRLASAELDPGTAHFQPSTLALTTIDVGNPANNVIPARAQARANVRFNDAHSSASLDAWVRAQAARAAQEAPGVAIEVETKVSGESFLTAPDGFATLVADAVEAACGRRPAMTTGGGTSDARFVKDFCPVVEFGLVGRGMHAVDERAEVAEILQLRDAYAAVIRAYPGGV